MKTQDDIRAYLARLKAEAQERARAWGYASDAGMVDGFGLTKYDCGLIITALGQFLGFKVYGKADWRCIIMPGQVDPQVNGSETRIAYLDRPRSTADYTWFAGERCIAVFETDGRNNRAALHLPDVDPVNIREHKGTNNLFKLSAPVLQKRFGYCPSIRAWVLFQVDNAPGFRSKAPWVQHADAWRSLFGRCLDLSGATVLRDTELFGDQFTDHVARIS